MIKGYGNLSAEEIELINKLKQLANTVDDAVETVLNTSGDPRWANIAKTQLQQGFMALARAVAKPEGF